MPELVLVEVVARARDAERRRCRTLHVRPASSVAELSEATLSGSAISLPPSSTPLHPASGARKLPIRVISGTIENGRVILHLSFATFTVTTRKNGKARARRIAVHVRYVAVARCVKAVGRGELAGYSSPDIEDGFMPGCGTKPA